MPGTTREYFGPYRPTNASHAAWSGGAHANRNSMMTSVVEPSSFDMSDETHARSQTISGHGPRPRGRSR